MDFENIESESPTTSMSTTPDLKTLFYEEPSPTNTEEEHFTQSSSSTVDQTNTQLESVSAMVSGTPSTPGTGDSDSVTEIVSTPPAEIVEDRLNAVTGKCEAQQGKVEIEAEGVEGFEREPVFPSAGMENLQLHSPTMNGCEIPPSSVATSYDLKQQQQQQQSIISPSSVLPTTPCDNSVCPSVPLTYVRLVLI